MYLMRSIYSDKYYCYCPSAAFSNYITGVKNPLVINAYGDCKCFTEGPVIWTRIGRTLAETYWYVQDSTAGLTRLQQICEMLIAKYLPGMTDRFNDYDLEKREVGRLRTVVTAKLGELKSDPLRNERSGWKQYEPYPRR